MEHHFYKRYVGRFVLICIGLFMVFSFLPLPGVFNLLLAMGASFYVGTVFGKDNGRLPTASEQNRFAAASFMGIVVIVGLLTACFLSVMPEEEKAAFYAPFQEKSIPVMIVGTLLAVLMLWGSIHFGFGLGGRKHMKSLEKKTSV